MKVVGSIFLFTLDLTMTDRSQRVKYDCDAHDMKTYMLVVGFFCLFKYSLITFATLSFVIPLVEQYFPESQSSKNFVPLLALQDPQQSAMFYKPLILIEGNICK